MSGGWEAEYEALNKGWDMYLRTIGQYLTYFPGQTATPISAQGPQAAGEEQVWEALKKGLGLSGAVREGDRARFTVAGSKPVEGVVDSVLVPTFLGVRTSDGLYRFVGGGRCRRGAPHLRRRRGPAGRGPSLADLAHSAVGIRSVRQRRVPPRAPGGTAAFDDHLVSRGACAQLTDRIAWWLVTVQPHGKKARRAGDEPDWWRSAYGPNR